MGALDEARDLLRSNDADAIPRAFTAARAAVSGGDTDAQALLALLHGAGVGAAQSWPKAMQHLEAAAAQGSAAARDQLAVLRAQDWAAPAQKEVLSAAPRVVAIDGFISPAVCDWVIGRAKGRTAPAMVYDAEAGSASAGDDRGNGAFEFGFLDLDLVLLRVRERIAGAIGFPVAAFEPIQALHYQVGQRFNRHHDYLNPGLPGHAADIVQRGQRVITFLVYLSDDFDAGETHFPHLALRRRCPAGGALYFGNVDPAGAPDPRTLHEGLAPTRGEKWLLSQWIRNRVVV